jgi:hypothetical protein
MSVLRVLMFGDIGHIGTNQGPRLLRGGCAGRGQHAQPPMSASV